jgi:hypothetical protein
MRLSSSPAKNSGGELKNSDLVATDALFHRAGLVRSLRQKSSPGALNRTRASRLDRSNAEELSSPAPTPRIATNGVNWLPVPGWEKLPWLWHGFSTRVGGVSRAYCPEDAPGELNLGYTATDSREAVARNRALFAEAVTGSPATPLIAVRQIHSCLAQGAV